MGADQLATSIAGTAASGSADGWSKRTEVTVPSSAATNDSAVVPRRPAAAGVPLTGVPAGTTTFIEYGAVAATSPASASTDASHGAAS